MTDELSIRERERDSELKINAELENLQNWAGKFWASNFIIYLYDFLIQIENMYAH